MRISRSRAIAQFLLQSQSAETIVVCCALIPLVYLWMSEKLIVPTNFSHSLGYYSLFGLGFLETGTSILLIYLIGKIVLVPVRMYYAYCYKTSYRPPHHAVYVQILVLFAQFIGLALSVTLITDQIYRLSPEKIAWASSMVNGWDRVVFGSHVPFLLQTVSIPDIVSNVAIMSYLSLGIVLSFVFIGLLLRNATFFRKYILAFFLAPLLSAPIWYLVPAISPGDMYIRNVTAQEISSELRGSVSQISPPTQTFLAMVEPKKSDPILGIYANTAFPSMHVAWGMIALWFGMLIWRPFLLVLIPWQLLNMFGAVYTLQHYAIDLPAGIGIAFLSIWVTHRLLGLESRLGINTLEPYAVVSILHTEVKRLLTFFQKHLKMIYFCLRKS